MTKNRNDTSAVCIFDAECGICQSSVRLARRLRARNQFVASQEFDFADAPADLTPERCQSEVVFMGTDGTVFGGAAAIAQILRTSRIAPVGAILDSRLVLPVAQIVYSWVARNRSRLPQACGVNASPDAHKEY